LVAGLPGTGKSTLAARLAERTGLTVVRSDVVRKELAGLSDKRPESLYTAEWTERTYAECLRRAERLLFEGKRVVVDATFREESKRRMFLDAAVACGVPGGMLLCQAGPEAVRRRLEGRRGDVSDADWSIYQRAAESWEEVGEATRPVCHVIRTEGNPEEVLSQAMGAMQGLGL
jgi:predicted kinase